MLENLELIGTGFAVVMTVLAAIWGACALIGAFFVRAERAALSVKAVATPVTAAPAAAAGTDASGVPPHHLAAIAAAVAHTLGAGYRVTRVSAPAHEIGDWPLEGRFETFTANRVRTDWGPTRVAQASPHTK
ncbi:OadG family transporter subunit [Tropicimonas isoalkanivorans]|uniref:Oxaloacetate decarboxylase, gamma chain n=1 Tax=Tropicimonas isoalkanivorans TaxID=441112 RepID=A0A1I1M3V8_9RHOB|nr:OadG family transporter subunit [Tropicimonas isoalkanivorans]SFC79422.1 Oxaloacetate decarboxylase, gamma chain [Tropicimonas isoalkanivorans]